MGGEGWAGGGELNFPYNILLTSLLTDVFSFFLLTLLKAAPSSTTGRRRRAWSESDDDEPLERQPLSRENSPELRDSDEEVKDEGRRPNGLDAAEDED